jgi:hypothetical protein
VSAFGESFTFGSDVDDDDTWEAQLGRIDGRFEVMNFGVPAYGVDQAYLRYQRDGIGFDPDIVVIGYMTENLARSVNVYRPFYNDNYPTLYTKPRFLLQQDRLVLASNPLTTVSDYQRFLDDDRTTLLRLGEHDRHYQERYLASRVDLLRSLRLMKMVGSLVRTRLSGAFTADGRYRAGSEAHRVTVKILEEFRREALANGSLPVVLIYPDLTDMRRYLDGQPRRYQPFLESLRSSGVRHLDLLDAFAAFDARFEIADMTVGRWGHLSPLGNGIVARYLLAYLEREQLSQRHSIELAVGRERDGVD